MEQEFGMVITSELMPLFQPKVLGRPSLTPVRLKSKSTSTSHETGSGIAPLESVVQFGFRTMESSKIRSLAVLAILPASIILLQK